MSMNERKCAIKQNLLGTNGEQLCGGWYKEQVFRVKGCRVKLYGAPGADVPLTVRIWTDLDGDATDESFAVDNLRISKLIEAGNARLIYNWRSWSMGPVFQAHTPLHMASVSKKFIYIYTQAYC